jgi:short-subunit dehydrogenase
MVERTSGYALVTGASSGIGAALARALPADQPLLLTALDEPGLAAVAAELARGGRPVETLAADLARPEGCQAVIDWAARHPLALLVNNAGLGAWGPLAETEPEKLVRIVQVNCLAPVLLTRALLPRLLATAEARGGRAGVIILASVGAWLSLPNLATYCASKAFDRSLGEALADELHDLPIDVLTVCPPATRSGFADAAGVPLPRGGHRRGAEPDAIAAATLRALGRRRLLLPGREARRLVYAQALVPRRLLRGLIRRVMRAVVAARHPAAERPAP